MGTFLPVIHMQAEGGVLWDPDPALQLPERKQLEYHTESISVNTNILTKRNTS